MKINIKNQKEGKSKVNICGEYKTTAVILLKFNLEYLISIRQNGYKIV